MRLPAAVTPVGVGTGPTSGPVETGSGSRSAHPRRCLSGDLHRIIVVLP